MSKNFLIILAVLVLGFAGFIALNKNSTSTDGDAAEASQHTQGAGNKGVTLVEYGDFQCPSCAGYFPILQEVKQKFGDDITFQFRHFPLIQAHQNAMAAHRAAEAASKQDKFWEMHDMLFERQQLWANSNSIASVLEGYASELGLDVEQFKQDYQSSETNTAINADIAAGKELKVTGTPTFFINGDKVDNGSISTPDELEKLINEYIEKGNDQ